MKVRAGIQSPYLIINLDYKDQVYIGKDTPIAYVKDENKSCEYLEVNEIITPEKGIINWCSPHNHKIVTSDLVYSPAQVTEHWCVELKVQNVSEETKQRFEDLKQEYPKVFSHKNEDIGHTHLETMDIDTGDKPPVCQKLYTLPLKHFNWVQREFETLEYAGVIKKSISSWTSPIIVVPKKPAPGQPSRWRMCIDFRKLNELQPEDWFWDSETGGKHFSSPIT